MPRPRYSVPMRDVPAYAAARAMGMTEAELRDALPDLLRRRFPAPDPTTGRFDIQAINKWQSARFPHLYPEVSTLTPEQTPTELSTFKERVKAMSGKR